MSGAEIITMGCRLNLAESHALAEQLGDASDLVIVNSCAVTNEAVRQTRQAIRQARKRRPDARIVVTGCAAQIEPQTFEAMAETDAVIGNVEKQSPALFAIDGPKVRVSDIMAVQATAPHLATAFSGNTRAFVEVQTGCDHRCTFCIIPFGRGASRSASPAETIAAARALRDSGKREIVLTGVDLTSYAHGDFTLGRLVRLLLRELPDLPRLRLSSIDCIEADADLLAAFAEEERLCPHLHLSLQSGDDLILKRMKRRHARVDAINFCERLRALRPDIVFGADIIVGFPTETEEMFAGSLGLVDDCGLTHLHVFPFSARPETPAARMPPVDGEVIKMRAARLRAAGKASLTRHLNAQTGKTLRFLVERGDNARAADFTLARAPGLTAGDMIDARVCGHDDAALEIMVSGRL